MFYKSGNIIISIITIINQDILDRVRSKLAAIAEVVLISADKMRHTDGRLVS